MTVLPDVATLTVSVCSFFRVHAADFALDERRLDVRYIVNPGGFVNASFLVTDGTRALHLKLSRDAGGRAALERWRRVEQRLDCYHAPPVIAWLEIDNSLGVVTPFLDGERPALTRPVVMALLPVVRMLHTDAALQRLLHDGVLQTAADDYFAGYHHRFTADLADITVQRPPFVDAALLAWLHDQVATLAATVQRAACFQEPLHAAVHGDLWLDNVLWRDGTDWTLLDWDELRIGDPACDIAMLTGPDEGDVRPLKLYDEAAPFLGPAERERLRVLGRASLLDWIIDPIADWIEAASVPAHCEDVRRQKQHVHARALALYRKLY